MSKRQNGRNIHGILLLDKRQGVSSNRAMQEVRRLFNANKAGHTGSLDPLATGLLPICLGEATKVSSLMLDDHKRYQVVIQLGIKTDTGDLEGEVIAQKTVPAFTEAELKQVITQFIGEIEQVPPMYSALKHNGKKLYELARAGKEVERQARRIQIFSIEVLGFDKDWLELEVFCSKGTYIRTLAEDIGEALNCVATVKALRRIQAGQFHIHQTYTFEQLQTMHMQTLDESLIAVDTPLKTLPEVRLNALQAESIKHGQMLSLTAEHFGQVRMYHEDSFLGLGEMQKNGKLAPKKLFLLNN